MDPFFCTKCGLYLSVVWGLSFIMRQSAQPKYRYIAGEKFSKLQKPIKGQFLMEDDVNNGFSCPCVTFIVLKTCHMSWGWTLQEKNNKHLC